MKRKYELIIWGASGFTGQLTAEYIQKNYGKDLLWAIGGRNKGKLEEVQRQLKAIDGRVPDIVVGDSLSQADMNAIASQTNVICSTVGPYAAFGTVLVAACVDQGTHYCDLTGESVWIRSMIDAHHEKAKEKSLRIVHCCGFDSIPSDIGVLLLQQESISQLGGPQEEVTFYAGATKGGFSGGTVASMLLMMEQAAHKETRRILGNPYALNPNDGVQGQDKGDQLSLVFDTQRNIWTAPFIMAGINTRVVRRSNALQEYRYGIDFRYKEVMSLPKGIKGFFMGVAITLGLSGFVAAASIPPIRKHILTRFLPKPGQGPTKEQRENGYFRISIHGETAHVQVKGFQDPGYGETSKMLGESAMCLVRDQEKLPSSFGILTPSTAMGAVLLERLRTAGMVFSFHID